MRSDNSHHNFTDKVGRPSGTLNAVKRASKIRYDVKTEMCLMKIDQTTYAK